MIGDIMFSAFFGLPAIIAVSTSSGLKTRFSRAVLFWGGWVAILLVAITLTPMLLCDGSLVGSYSACFGGDGLARFFTANQPLIKTAAMIYVLVGLPLAIFAFLVEWIVTWRASPT